MLLANRLQVPDDIDALLLDLDGVIVDSSVVEKPFLEKILSEMEKREIDIPEDVWRRIFPLPLEESLRSLVQDLGLTIGERGFQEILGDLRDLRLSEGLPLVDGIKEIIASAKEESIEIAVVSNNKPEEIKRILQNSRISLNNIFGLEDGLRPKPSPDLYKRALQALRSKKAVAIEDSPLGVASAKEAGVYVYSLGFPPEGSDQSYASFLPMRTLFYPGDPTRRSILTPSDFLSHMIEHIAWRGGFGIDLQWNNYNWHQLGEFMGIRLQAFLREDFGTKERTEELAMIDESLCLIKIEEGKGASFQSVGMDREWYLSCRVEDLPNGHALFDFLGGLGDGLGRHINATLYGCRDPHHGWEALFRGIGQIIKRGKGEEPLVQTLLSGSSLRQTAESTVQASALGREGFLVRSGENNPLQNSLRGWEDILQPLSVFGIEVSFDAFGLRSSHVVAEDMGITIGRLFRQEAKDRMRSSGILGYGCSQGKDAMLAISFEGRASLEEIALGTTADKLRENTFSKTLEGGLFVEDLDDFLQGFSQGMGCSIILARELAPPKEQWPEIYELFARALLQLLLPCPERKGLIAGVKSTLE